jgi:ERF superfamily
MEARMAEHKTLAQALAAFQAEVPKMSKDETAKVKSEKASYTYGYAGLDQFVEIVEPVLGKHGLSVTSAPCWEDGRFVLVVTLLHEGGEERNGYWPLPDPSTGRGVGPQDIGSAMTYGRRYVGWGLTGTFPSGIDDDGKQAQATARERWDDAQPAQPARRPGQQPANDRQAIAEAPKPPKTSWTNEEVLAMHDKLSKLELLPQAVALYDWMGKKGLHNRPADELGTTATHVIAGRLGADALDPDCTPDDVQQIRIAAESRGLLKTQVSETETLDQVLHEARELAVHAAVEQAKADTPDPRAE